jgi:hypothetical protein
MAITITEDRMTSDLTSDHAERNQRGQWITSGPTLGHPARLFDRNQAISALTLAEHLHNWGTHHHCVYSDALRAELQDVRYPDDDPITQHPNAPARCLYCGSTDTFEIRVTIDERTEDYALQCGDCHGVWAA